MITRFICSALLTLAYIKIMLCQPPIAGGGAIGGAAPPPPPLPPGRGFQLQCSDHMAYEDDTDANIVNEFQQNSHPNYIVVSVEPCIFPGKNAHRFLVKYRSTNLRRCEEIKMVRNHMNNYKPQNSVVGTIAVVPGGYLVEYKQYCLCYRRAYRRRRSLGDRNSSHSWYESFPHGYYIQRPKYGSNGEVMRCDDRDPTCGYQYFK